MQFKVFKPYKLEFKSLSFRSLLINAAGLEQKELEKYKKNNISELHEPRRSQLLGLQNVIKSLKSVQGLTNLQKAEILIGALLKIRAEIYNTYRFFSATNSTLYTNIGSAIGLGEENQLGSQDERHLIGFYDAFICKKAMVFEAKSKTDHQLKKAVPNNWFLHEINNFNKKNLKPTTTKVKEASLVMRDFATPTQYRKT